MITPVSAIGVRHFILSGMGRTVTVGPSPDSSMRENAAPSTLWKAPVLVVSRRYAVAGEAQTGAVPSASWW